MELYFGGFAQGKLRYVMGKYPEKKFLVLDERNFDGTFPRKRDDDFTKKDIEDKTNLLAIRNFIAAEEDSGIHENSALEENLPGAGNIEPKRKTTLLLNHFHLLFRKLLEEGGDVNAWVEAFLARNPDCIIISDEVGNGIVPIDRKEREYREQLGRSLTLLSEKAELVERVLCGLGMRLK